MDASLEYKHRHKALGLCVNCSRDALPKSILCALHLSNARTSSRLYRGKNRAVCLARVKHKQALNISAGKCKYCGVPNDVGLTCVNCQTAKNIGGSR